MDQKLKILIGTPAGGGQVCVQFLLSMLEIMTNVVKIKEQIFIRNQLRQGKISGVLTEQQQNVLNQLEAQNLIEFDIGLYTLSNESLLSRGRNHIASVAIRQGWDRLFFIDADAQWSWEQFYRVATAPYDFVAGACPLKTLPIQLNFLPLEDDPHYFRNDIRGINTLLKLRDGHKSSFVPIAFVGTAFMCLSRRVLLMMAEASEEYQYPNPSTGHNHTVWNIFSTKPLNGKYMSEDWSACHLARELGFPVMLNADVIIKHIGNMIYSPDMAQITYESKSIDGVSA